MGQVTLRGEGQFHPICIEILFDKISTSFFDELNILTPLKTKFSA